MTSPSNSSCNKISWIRLSNYDTNIQTPSELIQDTHSSHAYWHKVKPWSSASQWGINHHENCSFHLEACFCGRRIHRVACEHAERSFSAGEPVHQMLYEHQQQLHIWSCSPNLLRLQSQHIHTLQSSFACRMNAQWYRKNNVKCHLSDLDWNNSWDTFPAAGALCSVFSTCSLWPRVFQTMIQRWFLGNNSNSEWRCVFTAAALHFIRQHQEVYVVMIKTSQYKTEYKTLMGCWTCDLK